MKFNSITPKRRSRNSIHGLFPQRDRTEKEQLNRKLQLILKHYNDNNLYKTANISPNSTLLSGINKSRRTTRCSTKLPKNNQFESKDFPKLYTNPPNTPQEELYSNSPKNIINIVNNVNKTHHSRNGKKIDLKMNIHRYDIKCYLSSENKFENMLSNIHRKQKHNGTTITRHPKNRRNTNNTIHSEDSIIKHKSVGMYKKCISMKKRKAINLFITTDDEDDDELESDYDISKNKKEKHTKLKAKILKLFTLTQRPKNVYLDDSIVLDDEEILLTKGSIKNNKVETKDTNENVIQLKEMKEKDEKFISSLTKPMKIDLKRHVIPLKKHNQLMTYTNNAIIHDNRQSKLIIQQHDKQKSNVDFSVNKLSLSKNKVIQIDKKHMTHYTSKSNINVLNKTIPKVITANIPKVKKTQIINPSIKKSTQENIKEKITLKDSQPLNKEAHETKTKVDKTIIEYSNKEISIDNINKEHKEIFPVINKEKKPIIPLLLIPKPSKKKILSDNCLSTITKEKELQESTLCLSRNKESKLDDGILTDRKDDQKSLSFLSNIYGNTTLRKKTSQLKLRTKKQISIKKCIINSQVQINSFTTDTNVQLLTTSNQSLTQKDPVISSIPKEDDIPLKKELKRQKTRMMDHDLHGNITDNEDGFKSSKCSKRNSFTKETLSNKFKRRSTEVISFNLPDNQKLKKLNPNINYLNNYIRGTTILDCSNEPSDDDNSNTSNSSISQIESERLTQKIFHKIYVALENEKKLNHACSFDEDETKQPINIKTNKLYQFSIKNIGKKYTSLEKSANSMKEVILNDTLKKLRFSVADEKNRNYQLDYLAELKNNIDKEDDQNEVKLMSEDVNSTVSSLILIQTISRIAIPNDIKTMLLKNYFDLQDKIAERFLSKRSSMKTIIPSKRKNTQRLYQKNFTSLKILHSLAITNPENIIFIHQFITRDIYRTMIIQDENVSFNLINIQATYIKSNSLHSIDKLSKRHKAVKSRFNQGSDLNINPKEELIISKNIQINNDYPSPKNVPRHSFSINKNNKKMSLLNTSQFLNSKKRRESILLINSLINNNPRNILHKKKKNYKKIVNIQHSVFSSENKEVTLVQTNEIKNKYIESISDDKYAQIMFYINDCNLYKLNDIITKDILNIDLNYQDSEGNTFLIYGVQSNGYDICEFLLGKGCNPNITNAHNNSALHFALSVKNFKIADLLIHFGANENLLNIYGLNPWQAQGKPL